MVNNITPPFTAEKKNKKNRALAQGIALPSPRLFQSLMAELFKILKGENLQSASEYLEELKKIANSNPTNAKWSYEAIKVALHSKYHKKTTQKKKDFILALIENLEAWRAKK